MRPHQTNKLIPTSHIIIAAGAVVIGLLAIAVTAQAAQSSTALKPGDFTFSLPIGGYDRQYTIHVPTSYSGNIPTPLVIMLHGTGGNGPEVIRDSNWIPESEAGGFIVAAPDALPGDPTQKESLLLNPTRWRVPAMTSQSFKGDVDDVAFVSALIDDLAAKGNIDPNRVYAAGHSNGATMAYTVGVKLANRLAAIAPAAGELAVLPPPTKLDYPVSLILFEGTLDPLVPANGGLSRNPWLPAVLPPVRQSFDRWGQLLNCPSATTTIMDQNGVTGISYTPCDQGSEAVYYLIDGLGHVWPGGETVLPARLVGPSSNALNATHVAWEFFQKHPRTVPPVATAS